MASLQNLFTVQQQTKTPLQAIRDIRRQNQADAIAAETARLSNELKRLQIQETQTGLETDKQLANIMSQGFTQEGTPPTEAPTGPTGEGLATQKTGAEQSQEAAKRLTVKLEENPKMIENVRRMRDRLYSMGHPKAIDKATKLDGIISTWEQRNYFKKKEAVEQAEQLKSTELAAARAWAATPVSDRQGRLTELATKYNIPVNSVDEMNVWARDRMAAAKDITAAGQGGMKASEVSSLVGQADKIRKQFDTEMTRYFPEITLTEEGVAVDETYDEMRRLYSDTITELGSAGTRFNPTQVFAEIASKFAHIKQPDVPWTSPLSDMNVDVFIPRDWLMLAKSKNTEISDDEVAVLYSKIISDKKKFGYVSVETDSLMRKYGLN